MSRYFGEDRNWPDFRWNTDALLKSLTGVRKRQGRFPRAMEDLGFEDSLRACAIATEEDAVQTAAIEGENLDREKVRSSIAAHLGLPTAELRPPDRAVDGLMNMLLDAGKDGFEGGMTTRKYSGMANISRATAWREIEDLLQKKILRSLPGGGRSTAYEIAWEPMNGALRSYE